LPLFEPKLVFLQITPARSVRSASWIVGSTSACAAKVHSAGHRSSSCLQFFSTGEIPQTPALLEQVAQPLLHRHQTHLMERVYEAGRASAA
jgi:hypothetical protein